MNRFGAWLIAQRKERGWTQTELAGFIGCAPSLVVRWESGECLPTLSRFALLMRVLCADANSVLRLVPNRDSSAAA